MTGSQLKLTLNAIGRLLAKGDVEELTTFFECPLPVYTNDRFMLFRTREKLAEALSVYAAQAAQNNVRRIEPVILKIEDSTSYRCMFVIRWEYLMEDGTRCAASVVRYVGRRGDLDGMFKIELVEYLETGVDAFPASLLKVVGA